MSNVRYFPGLSSLSLLLLFSALLAEGQQLPPRHREFPPGSVNRVEDLPTGRLRTRLEGLPTGPRARAVGWLRNFHFTESDLKSLHADDEGGIYYADSFTLAPAAGEAPAAPEQSLAQGALPVSPFPASLIFHSRKGSSNVLYLNFTGENVTSSAWNNSLGLTVIPAVAFSTDTNYATFSDTEQTAIKSIWERVSEDYAPFDIDVTTERPAAFGPRVAHALITRSTDANGSPNPASTGGGVGYVNVFGNGNYLTYRPSWIYYDNLASDASYTAEAASHEIGHNMGLSHDGKTDGTEYYGGHGSGETSWGPIMGTGYNRNVSQWSKGEYYMANNTQDDLALIAAKISYRADDHGDTPATATPLVITNGTNVVSTTPESDPTNSNRANKGVLEKSTDVDVFSFAAGNGPINLTVNPWIMSSGTRGGNLDVLAELHNSSGALLLTNNPGSQLGAQIQTNLTQGVYYLCVRNSGAGNPTSATPTGYTPYASIGQYFINGFITPSGGASTPVQLTATVNNSAWGTVTPTNATYSVGAAVQVMAAPAPFYHFVAWTNGVGGTNVPLSLTMNSNTSVQALFAENLTTNHPTPYWWLASYGYSNNFETASATIGSNGVPFWQSYIAGLNPANASSQLRVALNHSLNGANILNWNTVTGRFYTLWSCTNMTAGFTPVPGASNLASNIQSFTNSVSPASRSIFYRIEVRKP